MHHVDVDTKQKNYFELFNLSPTFSISLDKLASTFKALQSQVHPDRYANASSAEKRLSVQHSSLINQAYQTLRNPLERAKYLLRLHGLDAAPQSNTISDPAFLMQQMELRERLEHIQQQADPIATLLDLDDDITGQINALYTELEPFFDTGDKPEGDLAQAVDIVNRLQFLTKLQTEISDKQHQFL